MHETPAVTSAVEATEDLFFAALRSGDAARVDEHLDERFHLVDVNSGSVSERTPFVEALRSGALVFDRLDLVERATRAYGDSAVVIGRTSMAGSLTGTPFAVASRYTHVFVRRDSGEWRLASGQGTPIVES